MTGNELVHAIGLALRGERQQHGEGLGRLGVATTAILCIVVLALVAYLVWLAVY